LKHRRPDDKRRSHQRRTYAKNHNQQKRFYPSYPIYDNSFYGYYFQCNQFGLRNLIPLHVTLTPEHELDKIKSAFQPRTYV